MSRPQVLLQAEGLGLAAGTRVLAEGLELAIEGGQFWALLGPNGSGKTTLLHTLAGLQPPAGGQVRLAGRPLAAWTAAQAACLRGLLPQAWHDAFAAPVLELVLLGRHPHLGRWAWEDAADHAAARAALASVELQGFEARDVLTLSGGERQRVGLAALLAQDPLVLLLDEPLAHLDLHHQVLVLQRLAELARTQGKAVVASIHDLTLAQRFATHALLLGPPGPRWGPVDEVMTEAQLAAAFGHRVRRLVVDGEVIHVAG